MRIRDVHLGSSSESFDLDIAGGLITGISPTEGSAASGPKRVLLPGLVDLHTHLREPGGHESETIATGTAAAAAGGYTDVFAMANTDPVTDSVQRVEEMRRRAQGARARVHVVSAATVGLRGNTLVDFGAMAEIGVTFFSDDGKCIGDEATMEMVLLKMAEYGTVVAQHAQDPRIVRGGVINARLASAAHAVGWPNDGEESIVARDIELVRRTGGRLHVCHVSTEGTVQLIRAAKRDGLPVTAEVTPHHLALTDHDALRSGPSLKVNPPLRSGIDRAALQLALRDGTIDVVATDHAPHVGSSKNLPWPEAAFGLTGLETALPVVAEILTDSGTGEVDWDRLGEVMSVRPAEIGGVRGGAGNSIAVGSPASFCIVEDRSAWTVSAKDHRSRSHNTAFEGRQFRWKVSETFLDGVPTYSSSTGTGAST